ncbi:hypothetical protein FIBSPDRAFT_212155 [Athelia psychrophila]|uniref:Phosphatase 2A Regulatory Subunit A helical domain-containing protein n=1 Tax=Athelia psychrophila TaxID=1759441 RepID=A0A166SA49_9AGAM|nr:hypothetical protein FIBSPDRAFT_212155 [Fibularhizoctonia sp. CBS 109695]
MVNLDPSARPALDALLHTARGPGRAFPVFPTCIYSFLHNYASAINDLPSPAPFSLSSAHPQHSALDIFLALSPHLTDEAKLDCMVPYMVDLLHDDESLHTSSVAPINFAIVIIGFL